MTPVAAFETFFRNQLLGIAEVRAFACPTDRIEKIYNMVVPPGTVVPYIVLNVIPLLDLKGQAKLTVMTRLEVDLKLVTDFPVPETLDPAIAAVNEHFETAHAFETSFSGGPDYRISVRHKRAINFIEQAASADQRLLHRGGTYDALIGAL